MEEIIAKDYARKVSNSGESSENQRWYIPHHGVYHSRKPDKIRLVFDCSAKHGGTSLNDQLIPGPDLTNSLIGVLTRFRQEPVAFMADIEAMFYQVSQKLNEIYFASCGGLMETLLKICKNIK